MNFDLPSPFKGILSLTIKLVYQNTKMNPQNIMRKVYLSQNLLEIPGPAVLHCFNYALIKKSITRLNMQKQTYHF